MTVVLDLPPSVEQAYLAMAQARGLPLAEVVRDVLVAAQPAAVGEYLALEPEEWVRKFQIWSQRHDQDDLPILSDEAISRESIYEDCGL
jgi:hypothetical protein